MFPQRLDSTVAYGIAKAMMDGFNRHYELFRRESAQAKQRFEQQDWHGQQRAQRERIEFYDLRVKECSARLETDFQFSQHQNLRPQLFSKRIYFCAARGQHRVHRER
jgi:isocitrate dehydrogenase kinase/phosphatase